MCLYRKGVNFKLKQAVIVHKVMKVFVNGDVVSPFIGTPYAPNSYIHAFGTISSQKKEPNIYSGIHSYLERLAAEDMVYQLERERKHREQRFDYSTEFSHFVKSSPLPVNPYRDYRYEVFMMMIPANTICVTGTNHEIASEAILTGNFSTHVPEYTRP